MPAAIALILFVASLGPVASQFGPIGPSELIIPENPQAQPKNASRVCVLNNGGFMLSFELWDTASNQLSGKSPTYNAISTYSAGQSCMDMSAIYGIEPGDPVVAVVYAQSGISQSMPPLLYSPPASGAEGATARFQCDGGARQFYCIMDWQKQEAQPGALVAVPSSPQQQVSFRGACVQNGGAFRMRVRLWDTATGAVGDWSQGFNQDGSACVDGAPLRGVASGNPLVLIVSPEGAYPASFRSFLYDPNATKSAAFACSGNVAKYDCKLEGARRRLQVLV